MRNATDDVLKAKWFAVVVFMCWLYT